VTSKGAGGKYVKQWEVTCTEMWLSVNSEEKLVKRVCGHSALRSNVRARERRNVASFNTVELIYARRPVAISAPTSVYIQTDRGWFTPQLPT